MIKVKMFLLQQPLFILGLFFVSCSGDKVDSAAFDILPKKEVEKSSVPFAFYKDVSVKPGLNFEVLSWGKGTDSVGGYLILISDTTKRIYKSVSSEREGILSDAWNMDLDNDGNPEVYIELLLDNKVRSDLHVYEYTNGSFNKITFPGLSSKQKRNYAGKDKFVIRDGDLYRTYMLSGELDSTDNATGTKTLHYILNGNSFSASEEQPR